MKKYITGIILAGIVIIAAVIRLIALDKVPVSPDWDEAALGYNAYSIMLTGKDEYGKFLPVVLQSFDDYKPALYAYLIIPFLKIFGLSVLSVRLPSAIFGIATVAAVYFLIKELFQKNIQLGVIKINNTALALLTAFLVAISPWHIQFSRVAFEAQVGLAFNIFALLFFLKALKSKYFLPLSFACAAISIYVYQSEKVFTPLLFLVLFTVYFKQFIKIPKKIIFTSFLLAIVIILPMALFIITNPNALSRAKGVSVFSDTEKLLAANTEKIARDNQLNDHIGRVFDNRRIEYVKAFTSGYISHFTPTWLFYEGDTARHHAPNIGLLYLWTLPFILIGIYVLLFSTSNRSTKILVMLMMLIVPIPAAITIDVPHAVRTLNFVPLFDLFTALGVLYVLGKVLRWRANILGFRIKYLILAVCFLIIIFNTAYYFNQYFVQMNYNDSKYWQYGWKEAVEYTEKNAKNFKSVVVTNVAPLDQSYIFFLFYTKYDPKKYQKEGGTQSGGFNKEHKAFGNYVFRPINWDEDKFSKNTLFIGKPEDLPDSIDTTIYYLNGERAIVMSKKYE